MAKEDALWNENVKNEDQKETLRTLIKIDDFKTGIVRVLIEQARHNDERKLCSYAAWLCNRSLFSEVNVQ